MAGDCIFCKIVKKEIPSKIVYEDGQVMAFEDSNPQAPVHILIVPKVHFDSILGPRGTILSHLIEVAAKIAKDKKIDKSGFRIVINHGADGGQAVKHLHLHLLGRRELSWPPG